MNSEAILSEGRPFGKMVGVALELLMPNPFRRVDRKNDDLDALVSSIKEAGIIHPLVVMEERQNSAYQIIDGERRWRASKVLRLASPLCIVLHIKRTEEGELVPAAKSESDYTDGKLTPLDEAVAIRGLLNFGLKPKDVARALGRSVVWVTRRSILMELSESWLRGIRDPKNRLSTWPPGHLAVISSLPVGLQDRMLSQFGTTWKWNVPDLHHLQKLARDILHILIAAAPWNLDDATLLPEAGACNTCPHRSSVMNYDLDVSIGAEYPGQGQIPEEDRCLEVGYRCWNRKAGLFLNRRAEELRKEYPNLVLLNNGTQYGISLQETFQAEVLNASDVAASIPSDGHAVPALVVAGPGLGHIKWVQPVRDVIT